MAYIPQPLGNYVKFIRGTTTAWANIKEKNPDTLYFIADAGATTGKLYLGDKLISDGTNIINNFSDLADIDLNDTILDDSLLVYNGESEKWENRPLGDVLAAIVVTMTGATDSTDGVRGLVPQPKAGQHNLFLRGDATWANPTAAVELEITNLRAGDTGSIREIAQEEVAKLVASAPDAYDTLKEIADWITDHDNAVDVTKIEGRLDDLETAMFGKEAVTDDDGNITSEAVPGVQDLVASLDEAVFTPVTGLTAKVSSLSTEVINLGGRMDEAEDNIDALDTAMTVIKQLLEWNELVDETTVG